MSGRFLKKDKKEGEEEEDEEEYKNMNMYIKTSITIFPPGCIHLILEYVAIRVKIGSMTILPMPSYCLFCYEHFPYVSMLMLCLPCLTVRWVFG